MDAENNIVDIDSNRRQSYENIKLEKRSFLVEESKYNSSRPAANSV